LTFPFRQEDLEAHVKQDIYAFLQRLSSDLVLHVARLVGISAVDADSSRVKLFEEIVLLGTEGFLDLQEDSTLSTISGVFGVAPVVGKVQQVEALMVHIFNLRSVPEKKGGGSARRRAGESSKTKQQEAEPSQKKQKKPSLHFASKSEVSKLKVAELRAHCEASSLSSEGLKTDLVDRLWSYVSKK
jgi:hypothetical protein